MGSFSTSSPFTLPERLALICLSLLALTCFISATFFPSIGTCSGGADTLQWFDNTNVLWFGWGGFIFGQIGWFANIPFIALLLIAISGRLPGSRSLIYLEMFFVGCAFIPVPLGHNEGFKEPVCAYGAGFWLWIAAQTIMVLTSEVSLRIGLSRFDDKV